MSDRLLPDGDGFTALDDEYYDGLIPTHITTRGALNDAEQQNIVAALNRRDPKPAALLDDLYLRNLHRAMFCDVWSWAGDVRPLLACAHEPPGNRKQRSSSESADRTIFHERKQSAVSIWRRIN